MIAASNYCSRISIIYRKMLPTVSFYDAAIAAGSIIGNFEILFIVSEQPFSLYLFFFKLR